MMTDPRCVILVEGPTGSGKSTVFPFLLARAVEETVVVAVPTRTAAIGLARYVASRLQNGRYRLPDGLAEETYAFAGGKEIEFPWEVGFAVRGRAEFGKGCKLIYATTGIALQMAVGGNRDFYFIVDEFHMRTIEQDALVGILFRRRQPFTAMSATLENDAPKIEQMAAKHNLPVIRVSFPALQYPVETLVLEFPIALQRASNIRSGLWQVLAVAPAASRWALTATLGLLDVAKEKDLGLQINEVGNSISVVGGDPPRPLHLLVFSPGIRETEQLADMFRQVVGNEVYEMHGSISVTELEQIVSLAMDRSTTRIFVSTDVSAVSVTLNAGIVVDPLVRKRGEDNEIGFNSVRLVRLTKAESKQRRGRAGRTAPGIYVCPFDPKELSDDFPPPEVFLRSPERLVLASIKMGIQPQDLDLPDPVSEEMMAIAINTLKMLGCVRYRDDALTLTPLGNAIFDLGLPARLGVPIAKAKETGDKELLATLSVVVSVLASGRGIAQQGFRAQPLPVGDVERAIRAFLDFSSLYSRDKNYALAWAKENGLVARALEEAVSTYCPDIIDKIGLKWDDVESLKPYPDLLFQTAAWLATGAPDRIGINRGNYVSAAYERFWVAEESALPQPDDEELEVTDPTKLPLAVVLHGFPSKNGPVATFAAPVRFHELKELLPLAVEGSRMEIQIDEAWFELTG